MNTKKPLNQSKTSVISAMLRYTMMIALLAMPVLMQAQDLKNPEKKQSQPTQQEYLDLLLEELDGGNRAPGDFPPIWNEPVFTDKIHGIIVTLQANPRVNNIPIEQWDYIGGFYTDDNGELVCGGADYWQDTANIIFPLFGDDTQTTPGVKDGFSYGEPIQFRLFSFTTMKDYVVDVIEYHDTLSYTTNGKWYNLGLSSILDMQANEQMDFYIDASANPICIGDQLVLSGQEFIGSGGPYTFDWSSDPPGFNYNTQFPPAVNPDVTTTYFLTVQDGTLVSEHEMTIVVNEYPEANAGANGEVCGNATYQLNGSAENYATIEWTTNGDGTFDDPAKLNAVYTPGEADNLTANVHLTLNVNPLNPCLANASDVMTLDILSLPSVDPGDDMSACGNDPVVLDANAQFYGTIVWTTDGDGSFSNPNAVVTQYFPAGDDIEEGVTLTVCAEAQNPCVATVCKSLDISYLAGPSANAPSNKTRCENQTVSLQGVVSNNSGVLWTSAGDGTFTNPNGLPTTYVPGPADKANGGTVVTLHALPIAPCTLEATKDVNIILEKLPEVVTFGPDTDYACSDSYLQLNAQVTDYFSIQWTTLGDGNFSSTTSLTTRYYPGPGDVAAGNFDLELIANANIPCSGSISEVLSVEIIDNPTAEILNANGQHVCEQPALQLNATAEYTDQVEWTTAGDGTFNSASLLNPTYTPGPGDVSSVSSIQLTLTAAPIAPCEVAAEDHLNVYFEPVSTANAGSNATICEDGQHQLNGTVANASSLSWTTSGDGTFSNASIADPVYTPGTGDIASGSAILTLEAASVSPCSVSSSDQMMLTITSLPEVNAGGNLTICENGTANISGVQVQNAGGLQWSSSGDGSFSNPNIAEPVYYPGNNDIAVGSVELTLTAEAVSPCVTQTSDVKQVDIVPEPLADAGADITACGGSSLNGSAQHYSVVYWETEGDGTFDNVNSLDAIYTPGPLDIANQTVELTLIANPLAPCNVADEDVVIYNIDVPQIQSDNVTAQEVYTGEQLQLSFVAQSATSGTYTWYRDGEQIAGQTSSTLTISSVEPEDAGYYQASYSNGCGEVESNTALIEVLQPSTHQIALPQGWSGISSYISPDDASMQQVFSGLTDDLVLVANNTGMYWPAQNINTLGDWMVTEGYRIKMANNQSLFLDGIIRYPSLELNIPGGWSYLPVNSICAVNVEELFGSLTGIKMIKDIAGTGIYWPEYGINTLQELYPGEAYQVLNTGAATAIKYPSCDMPMMAKSADNEVTIQHPWNEVKTTPSTHVFGFTAEAISSLEAGDVIGIFTAEDVCAGVMMVNDTWQAAALTAFANDPTTAETDGFEYGEPVSFKLYRPSTNQEMTLEVTYSNSTVEQGTWAEGAISVIGSVDYMATGIGEQSASANLNIYPNPTRGQLTLEFTGEAMVDGQVMIANANGQIVFEQEISRVQAGSKVQVDLSSMPKGVYYLRMVSSEISKVEKIILE